ncbi:hypothetical protein GCK72_021479 [Caenorhabditis remanei]|uniref:DUF281 domain-containing protein n=1 Tax=Caenorhabditis remanei TaxID=31234 RepID=A0A6A5GJK6_CAERE|nr:hypothetical protein GCK72_021479 [Caenorhabditis remanei]KAF1754914.1 hypothetical protein GCK72_021479 [Caenorhabditis remanei]
MLCKTCNIDSIAPISIRPNTIYDAEEQSDDPCLEYYSECRLENFLQDCGILQILAETTAGPGTKVIGQRMNTFYAGATINCANDGTFYSLV